MRIADASWALCGPALQDDEASETLPDVAQLDAKIAEAEEAMAKAETSAEKRKAKERKEDLMRLKRVEQIYVCLRLWDDVPTSAN